LDALREDPRFRAMLAQAKKRHGIEQQRAAPAAEYSR
jgi:hypothetical protein